LRPGVSFSAGNTVPEQAKNRKGIIEFPDLGFAGEKGTEEIVFKVVNHNGYRI
jgi:hypothetical protein